jgi:hypothetical protein
MVIFYTVPFIFILKWKNNTLYFETQRLLKGFLATDLWLLRSPYASGASLKSKAQYFIDSTSFATAPRNLLSEIAGRRRYRAVVALPYASRQVLYFPTV